jgi:hypothetical protein
LSQSLNTSLSEENRLKLLTRLVNDARLAEVPYYPYPPIEVTVVPTQRYVGDHDSLSNIQGDGFFHISAAQRSRLLSALQPADLTFGGLLGVPSDNVALSAVLAGKEPVISPSGNAAQFLNGNKAFAVVQYSQLGGRPTTLAGFGISASDTLFDSKYLQLGSLLAGISTVSGAQLDASTTVIQGFGRLQNQVNTKEPALGNPAANGYVLSSTTAGVRSWVPAPTGAEITGITLTGTNGITGSVVVTAGFADIVAGTNVTGLLKGNGTAISAAVPMTDYLDTTGASNGDTILYTGGVATWSPGLVNPMDGPGQMIYGGVAGVTTKLASNPTATNRFLRSVSSGNPSWELLLASDIPTIGITQVNGLQNTLDGFLTDSLAVNTILMGNTSSAAVNSQVAGDLTAAFAIVSGTNQAQFTIANGVVSYAKIQNVQSQTVLGRYALTNGVAQELTFKASDFAINSSTGEIGLVSPNTPILTNKGDILTHTGVAMARLGIGADATFFMADSAATTGNKWIAMSQDATLATSGALTISSGAVTLGKMANLAANSFIGNNTGSAATPIALSVTQATAMLNLFSTSAKGLVPATGGVGATYYLNATGSWSVPAGGGGGSGTVTSANQYSVPYYSVSPTGTTVIGLAPQTTNGVYFLRANVTASAAVAPDWIGSTGTGNVVLVTNPIINGPRIGAGSGQGHFHMHSTNSVPTGLTDYITVFGDKGPNKKVGFLFELDAFESYFQFNATTASKTYAFPDLSGTVALLANPAAFTSITTGTASSLAGDVIFQNASNANTQTLRGSAVASSIVYVLPTTAPTAGQVLSAGLPAGSPLVSTLSWTTIAGGGDVVGPASATDGDFAIFSGTTGRLIAEPANASLSLSGRATFNDGVDVGVSSTTTGTMVFRNSANAFTTTIQASTSAAVSLNYYWPTVAPSAGNILSSDASGNLSWTAAGSGDMTLAGAQTVTGAKTFGSAGNVGKLILAGSTSGTTILNAAAAAGSTTVTLPALTGTVALLENAQTFTGAKTFSAAATFSSSPAAATTVSISPTAGSLTNAQLTIGGTTIQWMLFGVNTASIPVLTTRSGGTKIVLANSISATHPDTAIGYAQTSGGTNFGYIWHSAPTGHRFWAGSTGSAGFANVVNIVNDPSVAGLSFQPVFSATVPVILTNNGWMSLSGAPGTFAGAVPTYTNRSAGTRIVTSPTLSANTLDTGIGFAQVSGTGANFSIQWYSAPRAHHFYAGVTTLVNSVIIDNISLQLATAVDIVMASSGAGTKIGSAANQLFAFWGKTPIVQPTTGITGATRVGGGGVPVTTTDTYGGYTLAQIAAALINTGILA